jgi:NADH-quinone oxidoreductase subunit N
MALASSGRFVVAWLSLAVAVLADLLLRGRAEGSIRRSMAALEVGLLVLAGAGLGALYWLTKVASLTQLVGSLAASPRAVPVVICASLSIAAVVGILVIRFSALLADGVGGTRTGAGVLGVGAGAIFLFKFGAAVSPDVRDWGPFVLILGAGILSIAMLRSLVASTPKRQAGDLAIAQLAIALAGGLGAFQLASTAGIYLFGIWMVAAMGVLVTCEVAEVKTWRALAGMGHNGGLAAYRAGALVIGLVSLAGVPPLGGWFGEIDVLSQFGRAGNWWWATLALAAWLLAAFAVVRALGAMLFETPHQEETPLYRPGSRRSGQARRTVAGSPLAWVGTILTLTLPAAYTIASQPIQSLAFQAAEAIGLR